MDSNTLSTGIQWRKSSYSDDQGGSCVECTPLGALSWSKSSYSGDQGGSCVEIAETPCAAVAVRDSKVPAGPMMTLAPSSFGAFVNWAATAAE